MHIIGTVNHRTEAYSKNKIKKQSYTSKIKLSHHTKLGEIYNLSFN